MTALQRVMPLLMLGFTVCAVILCAEVRRYLIRAQGAASRARAAAQQAEWAAQRAEMAADWADE